MKNLTMIWNNNTANDVSEIQALVILSSSMEFMFSGMSEN